MHRLHARLVARGRPATAFVLQPEPRTIGHFARGRQLIAGNFLFSGLLVEAKGASIWDISSDNAVVQDEVQGCAWLDDLAAVGDAKARALAQGWVNDWIARYGDGRGPGWTPDLVGRRLIRWINHGFFLLRGQEKEDSERFFRCLGRQTIFLSRRWKTTMPGLPRFEALTGMIYAGLSLEGMEDHVAPAVAALARDCATEVDGEGGIPTRNPEELLEVFTLLTWAAQSLNESGQRPPEELLNAIARIAPTLRALRHSDGSLARFHGGGRGLDGRLDHALATSAVKTRSDDALAMGFSRLTAGRTSLIIDAAPPPKGEASANGHASTLGFELTSGRRPLVVSCGSGRSFGEDWRRAGRATASHSTLAIDGYSSSRLAAPSRLAIAMQERLEDIPTFVQCEISPLYDGRRVELSHNGYARTHGLTHARTFDIAVDGRGMVGEDLLTTLSPTDNQRFDAALDRTSLQGIPFAVRFHLHPDVDATLDLGGAAVSMVLKSGEVWIFRQDGSATLTVEPSVYLENGRLKPRATKQVVLSGRAMAYATRVRWSLAKAQDTPDAVRDLVVSDPADMENE
ncbi:heparinase II/III family protein [Yoonia sp. 208BN28-4]|uniref:heparinase II/III family protein n=1 Tax=Yoonia sp. 208BN28-4 TaxID=3126505 RepID=UPI0030B1F312